MTGAGNDGIHHHRNGGGGGYCATGDEDTSADFPPSVGVSMDRRRVHTVYVRAECKLGSEPNARVPSVPYGPENFHCERPLNSWTPDLNAGWLTALDLNTSVPTSASVSRITTDLLGGLLDRLDAAAHSTPDWGVIFTMLKANLRRYQMALLFCGGADRREGDMLLYNPDSGYSYSKGLRMSFWRTG